MKKQIGLVADPSKLLRIVEILIELQGTLKYSLSRRTAVEVALIRAARAATVASIDDVLKMVRQLQSGAPAAGVIASPQPQMAVREMPAQPNVTRATPPASQPLPVPPSANELESLTAKWHEFIERVGGSAPLAKAPLRDTKPVSISADRVVIGVDPEFAKHREILSNPRQIGAIQAALKAMFHRAFNVEITVLGSSDKSLPADHPASAQSSTAPRKSRQEWANQPEVKRALDTFNGAIVDIRE
jgi:DNA polymerase III gamma/tau subunit